MQLSFGEVVDGKLSGRISLAFRNKSDLSVNGSFVANVEY